jgi:hypothetical protein
MYSVDGSGRVALKIKSGLDLYCEIDEQEATYDN